MNQFDPTFDYICHQLKCPRCGRVASEPCDIDLQTKLARHKGLRSLYVDDRLDPDPDPQTGGGYLELRASHDPERLSVIEAWSCPNCGAAFLWAQITLEGGVLRSVDEIALTEKSLSSADYITSEALMLFPMARTLEVKKYSPARRRHELVAAERALVDEWE